MRGSLPIWSDSTAKHWVWLEERSPDAITPGGVSICGQMLGIGEYEYAFSIRPADLPTLHAAVGLDADADPEPLALALRERWSEVRAVGIPDWLDAQGVRYEAWSRIEDD